MWTSVDIFRLLASSHLMVLAALCLRGDRRDPSARASTAFMAAVICHLVCPVLRDHGADGALVFLLGLASSSVPFAFWVLARVHFDDEFCLRAEHWALLAGLVTLRGLAALHPDASWAGLPRLVAVAFVVHALLRVYVGAGADLVVARIRLRYGVLLVSGTVVLMELLAELLLRGAALAMADKVHAAGVYLISAGVSIAATLLRPEMLRPVRAPVPGLALDPLLTRRLDQMIEAEQVFRQEGLTIAALAERLGAPEYKVRQLINAQLGFKNFNAFLNSYRIREAQKALLDPARRHLGIAQVAYEVGYRSLGPFNKAFKEITGRTPTDFRAASGNGGAAPTLADSENSEVSRKPGETGSASGRPSVAKT
jgi:AraC-like DNA-binding protein